MKRLLLLLAITLCWCVNDALGQYRRYLQEEPGGFSWYLVSQNGKRGAQDINGKTIIPCQFGYVSYDQNFKVFTVSDDTYYASYSTDGRCIIPISRHYTGAFAYGDRKTGPYYRVGKKNIGSGICDKNGKELFFLNGYYNIWLDCDEGKYYYHFETSTGLKGIMDANRKVIVEAKYRNVIYIENGEFRTEEATAERQYSGRYITIGSTNSLTTKFNPLISSSSSTASSSSSSSSSSSYDYVFTCTYYKDRNYYDINHKVVVSISKSSKVIKIEYGSNTYTYKFRKVSYSKRSGDYDDVGGFGVLLAMADCDEINFMDDNNNTVTLYETGGIYFDKNLKALPISSAHGCKTVRELFNKIKNELCQ